MLVPVTAPGMRIEAAGTQVLGRVQGMGTDVAQTTSTECKAHTTDAAGTTAIAA
jgi:hypothetical protein